MTTTVESVTRTNSPITEADIAEAIARLDKACVAIEQAKKGAAKQGAA